MLSVGYPGFAEPTLLDLFDWLNTLPDCVCRFVNVNRDQRRGTR